VGTDRLLNAYAAYRLYQEDAIVVDFGTAMSFSVVSSGGEFLGGVIAPGLRMAARALHEQTQALPLVSPQHVVAATGVTTEQAINAGLRWGASGMLDRILEALLAERPAGARILGTGGDMDWFLRLSRHPIEPHPNLTLQGLMFAFTHFQQGKKR
jgi:type III pantothenate kinase